MALFFGLRSGNLDPPAWDNPAFPTDRTGVWWAGRLLLLANAAALWALLRPALGGGAGWAALAAAVWAAAPTQVAVLGDAAHLGAYLGALLTFAALLAYEFSHGGGGKESESESESESDRERESEGVGGSDSEGKSAVVDRPPWEAGEPENWNRRHPACFALVPATQAAALVFSPAALGLPLLLALRDLTGGAGRAGRTASAATYAATTLVSGVYVVLRLAFGEGGQHPLIVPAEGWRVTYSASFLALEHLTQWGWPFGRFTVLTPLDPNDAHLTLYNLFFWLVWVLLLRQAWRMRRRAPALLLGAGWFAAALFPASGLLWHGAAPLHPTLLLVPSAGLAYLLAAVLRYVFEAWKSARQRGLPLPVAAGLLAWCAAALLAWCAATLPETARRAATWNDPAEVIATTLQREPPNFAALLERARLRARAGQSAAAEADWIAVTDHYADYPETDVVQAEILYRRGDVEDAAYVLETAAGDAHGEHAERLGRLAEEVARELPKKKE